MSESELTPPPRRYPTVSWGTLMGRALRLRCPRCGEGAMFSGPLSTNDRCTSCRMKFERAPGFFLGSIYVNYGLTAIAVTVAYVTLHVGLGWTNRQLTLPLTGFCMLFPALAFRHTRALWLAMDCHWDASAMEIDEETDSPPL